MQVHFVKGAPSLLPALERDLLAERARVKKQMQAAEESAELAAIRVDVLQQWRSKTPAEQQHEIDRLVAAESLADKVVALRSVEREKGASVYVYVYHVAV